MKLALIFFICLSCLNLSFAQDAPTSQLFGKWRITSYRELEIITPGMDSEAEKIEREKLYLMRSKGFFTIDSNYILTTNKYLDFDSCKFNLIHKNPIRLNIVKNDYSLGYTSSFDVWVDSNKVSDDFVAMIDKKYLKRILNIFDTDYKVDYGNETLKICLLNIDKIALYRSFDVIVLERNKLRK